MRQITEIIIHCSATPADLDIGVEEIRRWHVHENGWSDIGYHWVIRRTGVIEMGRPEGRKGAHTKGYNRSSIGICLIGGSDADDPSEAEFNFTFAQLQALDTLVFQKRAEYNIVKIAGHNEYNPGKQCPCFDVQAFFDTTPTPGSEDQ